LPSSWLTRRPGRIVLLFPRFLPNHTQIRWSDIYSKLSQSSVARAMVAKKSAIHPKGPIPMIAL